MPITDKLAFVHIPKTGGMSIESMMGLCPDDPSAEHLIGLVDEYELTHLTALEMQERVGREGRLWFSVVRNPWERLVSEFAYRMKDGAAPHWMAEANTFPKFVRHAIDNMNGELTWWGVRHFLPQSRFLLDKSANLLVDRLFLFRNIDTVGPEIFGMPTPHINAANHAPWWTMYDKELERIVADAYADDIALARAYSPTLLRETT